MDRFLYQGERTHHIGFPLGDIGAGGTDLAGNGCLGDWEIYNWPNKGGVNGFSHFAVRVEEGERTLDARGLQGDLPPPCVGAGWAVSPKRDTALIPSIGNGSPFTGASGS